MSEAKKASGSVFSKFKENFDKRKEETFTLDEYLKICRDDKMAYANVQERILDAIGEPEIVDTSVVGGRLNRLHSGKKIAVYPAFSEFYGMDKAIEQVINFLKGASRGSEEARQVLHLIGPPGGGKSTLAEKITELSQKHPIYALADKDGNLSPIQESPLGLFADDPELRAQVAAEFGIPEAKMKFRMSPWAVKRLEEAGGDPSEAFTVVKVMPSQYKKLAYAQVQPGSEQNQDETEIIGKPNIREIENFEEHDTDAYSYSGALCNGHRGVVEMVEIFKASGNTVKPLLDATQMGLYAGSGSVGQIPFDGLIISHCNESEMTKFSRDSTNEAFISRMVTVNVPYVMQYSEEQKIYDKISMNEAFADLPAAPKTSEILAKFNVLTRAIDVPELVKEFESDPIALLDSLNGGNPDGAPNKIKAYAQLMGGVAKPFRVGMTGGETREANKVLTSVFNYYANEGLYEADPLTVLQVLRERLIDDEKLTDDEKKNHRLIISVLENDYIEYLKDEMKEAHIGASESFYQGMFDRYFEMAKNYNKGTSYSDPSVSGRVMTKDDLDRELKKIEAPAGIGNARDFRQEVVQYILEQKAEGNEVKWNSYKPVADVIKKHVDVKFEDLKPVTSFSEKKTDEDQAAHDTYVANMRKKGYTDSMLRRADDYIKSFKP